MAWKIWTHQNDVQNGETMKETQLLARLAVEFKKEIELSQDKTEVLTGERIHKWQRSPDGRYEINFGEVLRQDTS